MLTGDDAVIAGNVASDAGIDEFYAGLLPDDKLNLLEKLMTDGKTTAFIGDGINDAPALARADVGIAMAGLDAAMEAGDVVLMNSDPAAITEAVRIARRTRRIVTQNIVFSLAVKGVFIILGAIGISGMWEAVFGDVGVMVIAVLNAMRILRNK